MNSVVESSREPRRAWPPGDHSRFVESDGIRWHVQVMGKGPALLLVHGTGSSSHSFRQLMPMLAPHFTVVAPDLPGHALSSLPAGFELSLPGIASALRAVLGALEVEPTLAVGHSAGAAITVRMTLDKTIRPRLLVGLGAALVPFRGVARALFPPTARLLARASKVVDLRVGTHARVDRLLRSTGSRIDPSGVELYRRLSCRREHVTAVLSMMGSWDLAPMFGELANLVTPLLLIAGHMDRAVPLEQQHGIAARVPHSRIVVLRGAGHLMHEEQPASVADLLLKEVPE